MMNINQEQLNKYLDSFALDPGFDQFASLCRANEIVLQILSDGLDLYINYLLGKQGYGDLPVLANRGELKGSRWEVSYPYPLGACGSCGNCKGDRIREYANRFETKPFVIFIGDGLSDRCATKAADWIFAKNDLADYCVDHNIEFNSFETFDEISRMISTSGRFRNKSIEQENRDK